MIYKTATFKVKKDNLQVCKKAIQEFVYQVKKNEPGTILYESFTEKDNLIFIHFMVFKDKFAEHKHTSSEYVKTFTSILYQNCSKKPVFKELKLVASNRR